MIPRVSATVTIAKRALQRVLDNLHESGFSLAGPVVRDGAIVIDSIDSWKDLPVGWVDKQAKGSYRLAQEGDSWFGFGPGPGSWKRFLYPPRLPLFSARTTAEGLVIEPADHETRPVACIGIRACDIQGLTLLDRIFLAGERVDPVWSRRRERMFLLALNCSRPSANCFCASMGTGPWASSGFDLSLTELPTSFVLEVGSEAGSQVLHDTGWSPTTGFDFARVRQIREESEKQMGRELDTSGLDKLLFDNLESPRWKDVASRCLGCGNCTMVCPTCFCATVAESVDLTGQHAGRERIWDSCFSAEFSHVHGGNTRPTIRSRYRQWLTHKFASFKRQVGEYGCVGCGRCITWCPGGVDVTEEIRAIREMGERP